MADARHSVAADKKALLLAMTAAPRLHGPGRVVRDALLEYAHARGVKAEDVQPRQPRQSVREDTATST